MATLLAHTKIYTKGKIVGRLHFYLRDIKIIIILWNINILLSVVITAAPLASRDSLVEGETMKNNHKDLNLNNKTAKNHPKNLCY